MIRKINDKEYELIIGECEQCVFKLHPIGCCSPMGFEDDCMKDEANKIWKEVSDEQK